MKDILKNDIIIKIVSLLLAILLWLYVMNVDNPYNRKTLTVPIKFLNKDTLEENDLFLKNENELASTMDITIYGRKEEIDTVNPSDFSVTVDFSKVESVYDDSLEISEPYLVTPRDVIIERYVPHFIKLELERIQSETYAIEINTQGELKENYRIIRMTVNPEKVPIRDLESRIKTIAQVKGTIDVNGLDRSIEKTVECKAYDKQGKEIKSLTSKITAEVSLTVAKEVPVTLVVKGKPAEHHVEVSRRVTPERVSITGPGDVLAGITELKTEPLDIENIKSSINKTIPLILPDNVKLVNAEEEVMASLVIEALEVREFTIARENIQIKNARLDASLEYLINNESVVVKLMGRRIDLNNVNVNNLKPEVDVGQLDEGTHKLPLNITLPPNISVSEGAEVEIKVSKVQQEETF